MDIEWWTTNGLGIPLREGLYVKFSKSLDSGGEKIVKGWIVRDTYGVMTRTHMFTVVDGEDKQHFIRGNRLYEIAKVAVVMRDESSPVVVALRNSKMEHWLEGNRRPCYSKKKMEYF